MIIEIPKKCMKCDDKSEFVMIGSEFVMIGSTIGGIPYYSFLCDKCIFIQRGTYRIMKISEFQIHLIHES